MVIDRDYYSGHLTVLISSGGVPHMFSLEIIGHDLRLHLAFTLILDKWELFNAPSNNALGRIG